MSKKSKEKDAKKKGGCKGCLKGCGIFLIILIIVIGIPTAMAFRLPQKLGIMGNAAEKHLVSTPDRAGAEELLAEAARRGLGTQGVSLYVFPYKEGEGSVAIAVLDMREGFQFNRSGSLGGVGNAFAALAGGSKAAELGIERVSMMYVSDKGQDLMTMSASRDAIQQFASGSASEEQFMAEVDGDINLPAIINEQIEAVNRMFE